MILGFIIRANITLFLRPLLSERRSEMFRVAAAPMGPAVADEAGASCIACISSEGVLLQMPCACRGSVGAVHAECLLKLRASCADGVCPTCRTCFGGAGDSEERAASTCPAVSACTAYCIATLMALVCIITSSIVAWDSRAGSP